MNEMIIHSDGAAKGNPGPGGWSSIIVSEDGTEWVSAGGFNYTTNNRMELTGVIAGLKVAKDMGATSVILRCDSRYVLDAIHFKWVDNWMASYNFKGKKNRDLWTQFQELRENVDIKVEWVRGHNGDVMNERCDILASDMANRKNLPPDTIYLNNSK